MDSTEINAGMFWWKIITISVIISTKYLQEFHLPGSSKRFVIGQSLLLLFHSFIGWNFKISMQGSINLNVKLRCWGLSLWELLGINICLAHLAALLYYSWYFPLSLSIHQLIRSLSKIQLLGLRHKFYWDWMTILIINFLSALMPM